MYSSRGRKSYVNLPKITFYFIALHITFINILFVKKLLAYLI